MRKRRTLEESRELLTKLASAKFKFDVNEYEKAKSKINFTCKKCGYIFQRTLGGFNRTDKCPKCEGKRQKRTHEEFIEEIQEVWGNKLDLTNVVYKTVDDKVYLRCKKHGIPFQQTAYEVLKGKCGCYKCKSEKITKANSKDDSYFKEKIHPSLKDKINFLRRDGNKYSWAMYYCYEHNIVFKQYIPHTYKGVMGCPKCQEKYIRPKSGNHNLVDAETFKSKMSSRFPNLDFSKVFFRTMNEDITVICRTHGEFITKGSYIRNATYGCPKCAEIEINKRYYKVPTWLYYVRLENKGKMYYKIGITKGEDILKDRFAGSRYTPFNITVLLSTKYNDGFEAYQEEQNYLNKFKQYKIKEEDFFLRSGNTEVFYKDVFNIDNIK